MRQSNLLANGQPQPCTVVTPMCSAPESLEQQRELRGIDIRPAIPHDLLNVALIAVCDNMTATEPTTSCGDFERVERFRHHLGTREAP